MPRGVRHPANYRKTIHRKILENTFSMALSWLGVRRPCNFAGILIFFKSLGRKRVRGDTDQFANDPRLEINGATHKN